MRAKLTFLSTLVVSTLGGVFAGCQTYDFEPVEPLAIAQTTETRKIEARNAKPNMMMLVDTSGSMTDPVNPALAACKPGGVTCGVSPPCDTTVCPTRWSSLQDAMKDFLTSNGTIARIGLATFPDLSKGDSCGTTSAISVPLPSGDQEDDATLTANALAVNAKLQAIKNHATTSSEQQPQGGTPTSTSLTFVGGSADLQTATRADFVLLLTDGLPNCNTKFPDPYPSTKCYCTLSTCADSSVKDIGCLDDNASVTAVTALRNKDIKTIVIGFGADFDSTTESGKRGAATLNAMANAGGFARTCSVDADCGTGDTCKSGVCGRAFYQAANKTELVAALKAISEKVKVDKPCLLTFDASERPSSQELVVVYLNGERLSPGADTWNLTADGNIEFTGSTCARIESSTPTNPANIEVRAVQKR